MSFATLLLTTLLAAGPGIELTRLDGSNGSGELLAISAESVRYASTAGEEKTLETSELRSVRFPAVEPPDQFADPPAIEVALIDGSRLACTAIRSQQGQFTLDVEDLGTLKLPRTALRSVRLAPLDRLDVRWAELQDRENRADMIVIRRQDSLDFVEGAVGEFGTEDISVLIQDQSRALPRQRTFGIIFAMPPTAAARPALQLQVGRSSLQAVDLTLADGQAAVRLAADVPLKLATERLRLVEFTGRTRLLGDLQPVIELPKGVSEDERYRYFRRGSEPFGAPLRIGADEVITSEGLWIHSGVTVRYRINRDYRRLAAVVGMDHNVGGNRSVRLVIIGDGKPLFDERIDWSKDSKDLDLDVTGVRDLEIRVDRLPESIQSNIFGIQEHLDLGNIRLVR